MTWIGGKNYGNSRDANHKTCERAFVVLGCTALDLSGVGRGCPDLLVGFRGKNYLVEVKNPKTKYGKKGFNEFQKAFASRWNGDPEIFIVRTIEDVEKLVMKWRDA